MFKYLFSTSWEQKKTDWKEFKKAKQKYLVASEELGRCRAVLTSMKDPLLKSTGKMSCFMNFISHNFDNGVVVLTGMCPNFDEVNICEKEKCPFQKEHAVYIAKKANVDRLEMAYKLFWLNKLMHKK